jgi:membrane-bound serine protease (ClpP class)
MEFFRQFGLLFSNMEWFVVVCLIVGLVSLLIEVFQPGFGVFGLLGVILMVLGVVLRAVFSQPEDNVTTQVFQLILIQVIIVVGIFILFIVGNKKNWWKNSPFSQEETAVNTDFSDGTKNFTSLIGKNGIASTSLHPIGKMLIDGESYDVITQDFFVEKGQKLEVIAVEGVKITVKSID